MGYQREITASLRRGGAFCYIDNMEHLHIVLIYYITTVYDNAVGDPTLCSDACEKISSRSVFGSLYNSKMRNRPNTQRFLQPWKRRKFHLIIQCGNKNCCAFVIPQSFDLWTYSTQTTLCK